MARQIDPSDERAQKSNDLAFSKFCEDFYVPHAKMHKKTWKEDVFKIDGQLDPAFGRYRLTTISARDISEFHSRQKERTSATTANHYATLIKRMFNVAVKWGLLEKSPATGLDRFKEKPHRERYLTKEELPKFLKALDELEELKAEKDNSSRTKESDYLFPSKKVTKRPHIYDLRTPFERACIAAGIEGLRIHDLRHSFATLALQGGQVCMMYLSFWDTVTSR